MKILKSAAKCSNRFKNEANCSNRFKVQQSAADCFFVTVFGAMISNKYRTRLDPFVLKKERVAATFIDAKPVQHQYTKDFVDHILSTLNYPSHVSYAHPGPKSCAIILKCSNKTCKKSFKFKCMTEDLKKEMDVIFDVFTNDENCDGKENIIFKIKAYFNMTTIFRQNHV